MGVAPNAGGRWDGSGLHPTNSSSLGRGFGLILGALRDGLEGTNGRLNVAQVEFAKEIHRRSQNVVPETVEEVLAHAESVVREVGSTWNLPSLPVINEDVEAEKELAIALPGEPPMSIPPRASNIP